MIIPIYTPTNYVPRFPFRHIFTNTYLKKKKKKLAVLTDVGEPLDHQGSPYAVNLIITAYNKF